MSPLEVASELGARVRKERLRQNLTQQTLADRAGVSRVTVRRMESDGTATLPNFLAILAALRRTRDLEALLRPPAAASIEEFIGEDRPTRQSGLGGESD